MSADTEAMALMGALVLEDAAAGARRPSPSSCGSFGERTGSGPKTPLGEQRTETLPEAPFLVGVLSRTLDTSHQDGHPRRRIVRHGRPPTRPGPLGMALNSVHCDPLSSQVSSRRLETPVPPQTTRACR
jgi:hypothetical protein